VLLNKFLKLKSGLFLFRGQQVRLLDDPFVEIVAAVTPERTIRIDQFTTWAFPTQSLTALSSSTCVGALHARPLREILDRYEFVVCHELPQDTERHALQPRRCRRVAGRPRSRGCAFGGCKRRLGRIHRDTQAPHDLRACAAGVTQPAKLIAIKDPVDIQLGSDRIRQLRVQFAPANGGMIARWPSSQVQDHRLRGSSERHRYRPMRPTEEHPHL